MTLARPVAGSSCITLLASLLANNTVPLSPAMGPSTLLPSHDHTTFQVCPAAITPGIAVEGRRSALAVARRWRRDWPCRNRERLRRILALREPFFSPGFCQLCRLLPRGNDDDGL